MKNDSTICYLATHDDGRCYVGISKRTIDQRKSDHKDRANAGSEFRFHEAIRKYGIGTFSWKVIAEGSEVAMRALERLLIYEWETDKPEKGFNEHGGHEGQIRYQMRKSEWKSYGPPWMEIPLMDVASLFNGKDIGLLDLMNDINSIVSYLEKTPLSPERCKDLRGFVARLQKRIDEENPSV